MDTKTWVEIVTSTLSTLGVIVTLAFTIYFQIKSRKDSKYLDISKLLDDAFESHRNLKYSKFSKVEFWKEKEHTEISVVKDSKIIKVRNSDEEITWQFITHYSRYLLEIDILLSRYEITGNIHCWCCEKKEDFNNWLKNLSELKVGEQWDWDISCKIFYDKNIKELTTMYCVKCAKNNNSKYTNEIKELYKKQKIKIL